MKKILDSDWLRQMQFLGTPDRKKVIQCRKKRKLQWKKIKNEDSDWLINKSSANYANQMQILNGAIRSAASENNGSRLEQVFFCNHNNRAEKHFFLAVCLEKVTFSEGNYR